MIPRIIHFFWTGPAMPDWALRNIEEFQKLNPSHEIMVHGEEIILPEYEAAAERIRARSLVHDGTPATAANLSDLARYSAIEKYGGWYFDTDIFPFRSIEEIERAYCLDGDKLFLARQAEEGYTIPHDGEAVKNDVAAAVLGIGTSDAAREVMRTLRDMVCETTCTAFVAYGPAACSGLASEQPHMVEVAGCEWFYGIRSDSAATIYRHALHGNLAPARHHSTGGQLPYAMHLWAHSHSGKIDMTAPPAKLACICGDNAVVHGIPRSFADSLKSGLEASGWTVINARTLKEASELPGLCIVWNHKTAPEQESIQYAKRIGCATLIMELGFYDRRHHCQIDAHGFSHTASWCAGLKRQAKRTKPQAPARREGYCLVLGQVGGDRQLDESEVRGMPQLEKLIGRAMPNGLPVYFRPHPADTSKPHPLHESLPRTETRTGELAQYREHQQSGSLADALEQAAFVVTVNSTAIYEAMSAGVPVLAFGPHPAIYGGAARPATIATLKDDLSEMAAGWQPDPRAVKSVIFETHQRQHHIDNLKSPDYLTTISEVPK